ncbi:LysR family transcriptional regulator [Kaustia mangrovi]|uniref:LysR family transcriptional regulator n=1 Tax=Kaustia mangrovi TaxID=2593653 RepID=A0A7S8C380_9HYPH|nr:LysR substrate-binding domain-containing protein [Kaustia mangrovi]QPC42528.1 LysR family transcriptional regulator [Kaustia mangrovi]
MITTRQLDAFRAVMRHGTVTEAAELLNLTQPAVSKLIAGLERETQLTLFQRVRKRLVPTAEGEQFFLEAERMVLGLEALQRVAEELRTMRSGRLSLVAMPALGQRYLPRLVARFLKAHPDAEVSLHVHGSQIVNQWVAGQQVDLGLSLLNIEHPSVLKRTLCRVEAVAALPPGHPLAEREHLTPADFAGEPFIAFTRDTRIRHAIDQVFEAADVDRVQRVETYISEAACSFVAEGMGVSLVDPLTAAAFVAEGSIVSRPFSPAMPYQIRLLRPRHHAPSKLGAAFEAFLDDAVPEFLKKAGIRLFS